MKSLFAFTAGGILILFASTSNVLAQDWKKVNPGMNKVLVDTTLVLATEVMMEPGQKSAVHTHPANFFYALTDGKIIVRYTDGKNETFDLKAGDSGFGAPEHPHTTENVGTKALKFLLVELKEHPYKAPQMKNR